MSTNRSYGSIFSSFFSDPKKTSKETIITIEEPVPKQTLKQKRAKARKKREQRWKWGRPSQKPKSRKAPHRNNLPKRINTPRKPAQSRTYATTLNTSINTHLDENTSLLYEDEKQLDLDENDDGRSLANGGGLNVSHDGPYNGYEHHNGMHTNGSPKHHNGVPKNGKHNGKSHDLPPNGDINPLIDITNADKANPQLPRPSIDKEQQNIILKHMETALNAFKDPINYVAFITAIIPAINAFALISEQDPRYIGQTWGELEDWKKYMSVFLGTASLTVNFKMNQFFYPRAWKSLKELYEDAKLMREDPEKFKAAIHRFFWGVCGALTTSAIAYDAFQWLPEGDITSVIPAIMNFIPFFAVRYVGANNFINRVNNFFNKKLDALSNFADVIKRLNYKKYSAQITKVFDECMEEWCEAEAKKQIEKGHNPEEVLDEEEQEREIADKAEELHDKGLETADYQFITSRFAEKLRGLVEKHPDLVLKETNWQYFKEWAGLMFDFNLAIIGVGIGICMISMQKGVDGIGTIFKFAGKNINQLAIGWLYLMGLFPGLASTMAYVDSAIKFRDTLITLLDQISIKDVPFVILLTAFVIASGAGPMAVAAGVARKPNLFGLHIHKDATEGINALIKWITEIIVRLNGLGGTIINGNNALFQAFLSELATAITLSEKDLATQLKTNFRILTPETENSIKKLFKEINAVNEKIKEAERIQKMEKEEIITPETPSTGVTSCIGSFFSKVKNAVTCCAKDPDEIEERPRTSVPSVRGLV